MQQFEAYYNCYRGDKQHSSPSAAVYDVRSPRPQPGEQHRAGTSRGGDTSPQWSGRARGAHWRGSAEWCWLDKHPCGERLYLTILCLVRVSKKYETYRSYFKPLNTNSWTVTSSLAKFECWQLPKTNSYILYWNLYFIKPSVWQTFLSYEDFNWNLIKF